MYHQCMMTLCVFLKVKSFSSKNSLLYSSIWVKKIPDSENVLFMNLTQGHLMEFNVTELFN